MSKKGNKLTAAEYQERAVAIKYFQEAYIVFKIVDSGRFPTNEREIEAVAGILTEAITDLKRLGCPDSVILTGKETIDSKVAEIFSMAKDDEAPVGMDMRPNWNQFFTKEK